MNNREKIDWAYIALAKKFASANRRKDIPKQIELVGKISTVGRTVRVWNYPDGNTNAMELHYNGTNPAQQQAHMERWDAQNEMLVDNEWHGTIQFTEGRWNGICPWSAEGWCTTLDQAVNHVPNWLGTTVPGQLLNYHWLLINIVEFVNG